MDNQPEPTVAPPALNRIAAAAGIKEGDHYTLEEIATLVEGLAATAQVVSEVEGFKSYAELAVESAERGKRVGELEELLREAKL